MNVAVITLKLLRPNFGLYTKTHNLLIGSVCVLAVTALMWFVGTVLDECWGVAYGRGGQSYRWLHHINPYIAYGTLRILPIIYAVRVVSGICQNRWMFLFGTIGACLGPMTGIYTYCVSYPWSGARSSADDWQIMGVIGASIAIVFAFFFARSI